MHIELLNIHKGYKTSADSIHVLKDITCTIEAGEWLTITGPSGSGKTTLLRCLSAIESVDEGDITVDDLQLKTATEDEQRRFRRESVGYIFQDFQLFDQFDVLTNVIIPQLPDHKREEIEKRAKQLLERVGLSERLDHMPSQLSGGEKQRVAIARALMNDPKILLCDEPTGSLDVENRDQIIEALQEIHSQGVTIILVTHDPELGEFGNTMYELRAGHLTKKEMPERKHG